MSLLTIEGRFKDGKVDLKELPDGIAEARVLVTFLPQSAAAPSNDTSGHIKYGMFKGPKVTNEDDFAIAEWRGGKEDEGG